jgi:hypothetical protein
LSHIVFISPEEMAEIAFNNALPYDLLLGTA